MMPTNTRKLKARIVECGYTTASIAKKIGISRQSLSAKLNNRVAFRATEISALSNALMITDLNTYFFCEANSQNG